MADDAKPAMASPSKRAWTSNWFSWTALALQAAIIVLYGTCTKFEHFIATDHENAVRTHASACARG